MDGAGTHVPFKILGPKFTDNVPHFLTLGICNRLHFKLINCDPWLVYVIEPQKDDPGSPAGVPLLVPTLVISYLLL